MKRRPNLFVIGAMKSGTSALHRYLATHPQILMSKLKEPMYFSNRPSRLRGLRWYLGQFGEATDELYLGESSTSYTKRPRIDGVAARIHRFSPSARIVYLLRDPFDRVVSHYKHMLRSQNGPRSLGKFLRTNREWLANSYYAYQLEPYLALFGSGSVYVETTEALGSFPVRTISRLLEWLAVDSDFIPPNLDRRFHVAPDTVGVQAEPSWIHPIHQLLRRLPLPFRRLRIVQYSRTRVSRLVSTRLQVDFRSAAFVDEVEEWRTVLSPLLSAWIVELRELTGHSYDEWPTASVSPSLSLANLEAAFIPAEIRARLGSSA